MAPQVGPGGMVKPPYVMPPPPLRGCGSTSGQGPLSYSQKLPPIPDRKCSNSLAAVASLASTPLFQSGPAAPIKQPPVDTVL
ncbi:GM10097 [Drosophila sechellia]|uniref:GM10097 n=1 Tax=Drosophila sechellia TaxID=7238 RepID=B4ILR5_DROSE|nr:GM19746 [Drosophila sechellia]EDW54779.1 GM10097 [Drosophila sechellia]